MDVARNLGSTGTAQSPAGSAGRSPRLRRFLTALLGDSSGATALEFALLAGPLFLIIFGIIDMGLMMVASTEIDNAAAAAVRQIRTGAVQQAQIPSTYLGDSVCKGVSQAVANQTVGTGQNCLGFTILSSDTASTIFGKLLCANIFDRGVIANCNNFYWNFHTYTSWSAFNTGYQAGDLALPFNATTGAGTFTFQSSTGSQIVAGVIAYKRPFIIKYVGCVFDPADCGGQPKSILTYYAVFRAEPFG